MAPRIVLYAGEKFGKTSAGCYSTKPVFLMTAGETGLLSLIEANRVPADTAYMPEAKNWSDVWVAVRELIQQPHDFQTLVIDTGNGAEQLCAKQICDDHFGGDWSGYNSYGRGNEQASKAWAEFLAELDTLRFQRKMTILILQHAKVKTFQDPTQGKDWDQWRPEAIEKCWALTHKWADAIIFGGFKVTVKDDKATAEKRYLRCAASGAIVAGNRYGLPPEITAADGAKNLWDAFAAALAKAKGSSAPPPANGAPPTNGTPPAGNGTKPKTVEEKAAWFKAAIAKAHQPGGKRKTAEEELAYLTKGVKDAKFEPAIEAELFFLLCSKAVSIADLAKLDQLDQEFSKLAPSFTQEQHDRLVEAMRDRRIELTPPPPADEPNQTDPEPTPEPVGAGAGAPSDDDIPW